MDIKPLSLVELQRLDNLKLSDHDWVKARMRALSTALKKAQDELKWALNEPIINKE